MQGLQARDREARLGACAWFKLDLSWRLLVPDWQSFELRRGLRAIRHMSGSKLVEDGARVLD